MKTAIRTTIAALTIATGLSLAAGAGLAGQAAIANATTADDVFLSALAAYNVPEPGGASEAIRVAHLSCSTMRAGDTPMNIVDYVFRTNATYTIADAGHFVGASIGAYCPEQGSRIPSTTTGSSNV